MNKIVDSRTYKWQKDLLDAAFDERQISPMIKVIVCGGRDFSDLGLMTQILNHYIGGYAKTKVELVSGGARGADTLAIDYGAINHIPINVYYADWNRHGKRAGYLRNAKMAQVATHCIAFWDGKSHGTKHMIDLARKNSLLTLVINY